MRPFAEAALSTTPIARQTSPWEIAVDGSDFTVRAADVQSGRQNRRFVAASEPFLQVSATLCAGFLWGSRAMIDFQPPTPEFYMNVLILFVGWCILLAIAWPVALIALVLLPFVWLLSLPIRAIGMVVRALLALLRALLFLPARILGYRG